MPTPVHGLVSDVVWDVVLSRASTFFGRIVLLSTYWQPNEGSYSCKELADRFGEQATSRILRALHEQMFRHWLSEPMTQKSSDLWLFLCSEFKEPPEQTVDAWKVTKPYNHFSPPMVLQGERKMFYIESHLLLVMLSRCTILPRLMHIVERTESANISLSLLAKQLEISSDYLRHVCKSNTGITFRNLIRHIRMKRAVYLLRNTALTVGDLARECGYTAATNFSNVFKSALGVTPTSYRLYCSSCTPEALLVEPFDINHSQRS